MGYSREKLIEADNSAIEIQSDDQGHSRFLVLQRGLDGDGRPFWTTLHTSGLYADTDDAEADGLRRLESIKADALRGMTVNERLVVFGLMEDWEQAARAGDREALVSIMSKLGLHGQAATIIDAALAR